jgi:hypothetical protein
MALAKTDPNEADEPVTEALYDEVAFDDLPEVFENLSPEITMAWYGPPGIGKSSLANAHPKLQPVAIIGLAVRQAEDIGGCPMPDPVLKVTHIFPLDWWRRFSLPADDYRICRTCQKSVVIVLADDKQSGHIECPDTTCKQEKIILPKGTIIFDEFDKGTTEKQTAVMRCMSERDLEGFKLSPLVRIIIISNREQDNCGVFYEMPLTIKNRAIHFGVRPSFVQWERDYATPHGIHSLILTWLKENPDKLVVFKPNEPAYGFATSRTWTYASEILFSIDQGMNRELGRKLLVGCLGRGIANEFWTFKEFVDACPPIDELASGRKEFPPIDRPDRWIALVARCLASAEAGLRLARKDTRVLQQVCQVLAKIPDASANYRTMLGIWLRKRPLTRHLVLDVQRMGTDKHLAKLGDDFADMERPTSKNVGTNAADQSW